MITRVFDHIPIGEDGLKEIYAWIDRYSANNSGIAKKLSLGKSEDGRWEVPAVVVTNPKVPESKKQIAIITLARHGNEQGARVVGPEILNYLAGDEAREIRDKQIVIVAPIVNPEGMAVDEPPAAYGITNHEKRVLGRLCAMYTPDMMLDYHSLGHTQGAINDVGDMEVIIPSNTTRFGMDEQIYQHVANRLKASAEDEGWPYEVHTLEQLSTYYFGDAGTGMYPQKYIEDKVFLLRLQNTYEQYDGIKYNNFTNGPAYMKWHTMVFGVETNHWSIPVESGLGESGLVIAKGLLDIGNRRCPWERHAGYPTNIIAGDFRMSVRAAGKTPVERRASREKIWKERDKFNIIRRTMGNNLEATFARLGYMGENDPFNIELCLRMRQSVIKKVFVDGREAKFATFKDNCSTYVSIPLEIDRAGTFDVKISHEAYRKK